MKSRFRIKELRMKAGLTQKALADAIGVKSASLITMWEKGERKPKSEILPELSRALNCEIKDLFDELLRDDAQAG